VGKRWEAAKEEFHSIFVENPARMEELKRRAKNVKRIRKEQERQQKGGR
jgi:hypothetical protein